MSAPVFIHGAGGFIGTRVARALVARGQPVVCASRSPFDAPPGARCHVGALREPAAFDALIAGCGAVLHVASASTPGSTAGDPLAELDENLAPTLALLAAMQAHPGLRLVYVSSGGNLYPPTPNAADEATPLRTRSYHGAGKAAAEQFIAAWCAQFGRDATVLRPSNVYGPGQSARTGFAIVPTAMDHALRGEPLVVWGDGSAVRDYLYIDDFVALCLAILDAPVRGDGFTVYNAASGRATRLDELLSMIEAVGGRPLRIDYGAPRPVDVPRVELDASAARARFGWSPRVDLGEGLARTWAWRTSLP
jgi:UDP-glucose 4-epimerase